MSNSNNPPQPPQGWQPNNGVPPVPGSNDTAPTVAFPSSSQVPAAPNAPQGQPPFGGQNGPSSGGQQSFGGQPSFGQPSYGQPANNSSNFSGNGLPPYNGGSGGPGGPDGQNAGGKKNLWVFIVIGVLVLALAGAAIWAFTVGPFAAKDDDKNTSQGSDDKSDDSSDNKDTDASPAPTTDKDKKPAKADSEKGTVEAFLNALADGDVETANSYLSKKVEGAFGDPEVVKAAVKAAPITDIEIEGDKYDLTATFMVGDEEVSMDMWVSKSGKNFKLEQSSLGSLYPTAEMVRTGVKVNGVEVELKEDTMAAFPIQYEFSPVSEYLTFEGTTTFVPYGFNSANLYDLEMNVSDDAKTKVQQAIKDSVAKCLTEKTLVSSCGMDVPATLSGGETVQDGTVTRSLDTDEQADLDSLELDQDYDNPLMLTTYESFYPTLSATCTDTNGNTGTCEIITFSGSKSPKVDLSKDPITVVWE